MKVGPGTTSWSSLPKSTSQSRAGSPGHSANARFGFRPDIVSTLPASNFGSFQVRLTRPTLKRKNSDKERLGGRMIPAQFTYHRPTTLAEAVRLLVDLGEEARPLAGGHSLIPMMKTRLASPEHLVDLQGIDTLKGITRSGNRIVIGAMTTQHELLQSDLVGLSLPILHETALMV